MTGELQVHPDQGGELLQGTVSHLYLTCFDMALDGGKGVEDEVRGHLGLEGCELELCELLVEAGLLLGPSSEVQDPQVEDGIEHSQGCQDDEPSEKGGLVPEGFYDEGEAVFVGIDEAASY